MSAPGADRDRVLARAREYPYTAPSTSFVLHEGREHALSGLTAGAASLDLSHARVDSDGGRKLPLSELASGLDPAALAARTPVLAYGANRCPEALERKRELPSFPADAPIIVLRARTRDLDVVYSAHISPYGSVGATLRRSPGTSAEVAVILLTDQQLAALGETEPNYTLEELDGPAVEPEGGGRLRQVRSYVSRHGCLALDGEEVALAAIPARGRRLRALTQPDLLAAVAARLGHHGELDDFILENVADPDLAAARTRELRSDVRPHAPAPRSERRDAL